MRGEPAAPAGERSRYVMFGAEISYYSGKLRCYLRHKAIPFVERQATGWIYLSLLPRRVGAAVVPVVLTPEGEWLQDTSVIIDELERRFPEPSVLPSTPVQRFVAYLFELWGDEFVLPLAMHTRWNRPEHVPWITSEMGRLMIPGWPRWLQLVAGGRIAARMQAHAETIGFGLDMAPVLERFGQTHLDALNRHFARHRFLLGERPSLGDYGLIGPLYAHVGRDPLSKRDLVDSRPHLRAWITRMVQAEGSVVGELIADDRIPDGLLPALRSIFDEMVPFLAACADEVRRAPIPRDPRRAPRFLGAISYPMAGDTHRRLAGSYPVWMAQRLLAAYTSMPEDQRGRVRDWLASVGGEGVLQLDLPRMRRVGMSAMRLAEDPAPRR